MYNRKPNLADQIGGFFLSLAPLVLGIIFILTLSQLLDGWLYGFVSFILLCLAIYIGIQIFKAVQIEGITEYLTISQSSNDLDFLLPTSDDHYKVIEQKDFIQNLNQVERKVQTVQLWRNTLKENEDDLSLILMKIKSSKRGIEMHYSQGYSISVFDAKNFIASENYVMIHSASKIIVSKDEVELELHTRLNARDIQITVNQKKFTDKRYKQYPALTLFFT